jgi:hypothetical protein
VFKWLIKNQLNAKKSLREAYFFDNKNNKFEYSLHLGQSINSFRILIPLKRVKPDPDKIGSGFFSLKVCTH